jgi:thioredoxin 1
MAHGIVNLTADTFDETINSSTKAVVVDFWAEWCGPCKMIAPILSEIAAEQADDLAMRFGVQSIPTILVFKDGTLAKRMVGAKPKGQMLQELSEFLPSSH